MSRHSHEVFDSKRRGRGLIQRVGEAIVAAVATTATAPMDSGRTGGNASVKASGATDVSTDVSTGGSEGGLTDGDWSGLRAGDTSRSETLVQGGNSPGCVGAVQSGELSGEPSGELPGVELHVVDGRLIACRPGELPPLSVRQYAQIFLEWLRAHEKVPGNEVPVATLEHVLYWDFLHDAGLPLKSWRAVSDALVKLPGVKKYQADWRDPAGYGPTPVVVKIAKRRRRAKVVKLPQRKRA